MHLHGPPTIFDQVVDDYEYGKVNAPIGIAWGVGVLAIATSLLPLLLKGGEEALDDMRENEGYVSIELVGMCIYYRQVLTCRFPHPLSLSLHPLRRALAKEGTCWGRIGRESELRGVCRLVCI